MISFSCSINLCFLISNSICKSFLLIFCSIFLDFPIDLSQLLLQAMQVLFGKDAKDRFGDINIIYNYFQLVISFGSSYTGPENVCTIIFFT